ncbi:MAG: arginine--tRNA ligase [Flavobacteriales bacterium]|nr:arginine--tRNA ligase [Flavobacteriales bacterium]
MESLEQKLASAIEKGLNHLFNIDLEANSILLQGTKKDFIGDFTLVVFPYLRASKMSPEKTAEAIGEYLVANCAQVSNYNVVKGFLNISISNEFWITWLKNLPKVADRLPKTNSGNTIMVEYSSPNTNKPLHLGHIRNNLLGYSVSEILKANGHRVLKTQVINDKGIHICKSMLAWLKYGEGETPNSSGLKGDKLVGKYYVKFDKEYKKEILELLETGMSEEVAKAKAPLMIEAQEMLRQWEAKDTETLKLWETMNSWVYQGFDVTYQRMGVDFDQLYYESFTYLYGKEKVLEGVEKGVFYKKEDGSVWVDLTENGLDEKLLLRSDGTSVYMTQDIGTAILRVEDHPSLSQLIYTVGNEQDYHFKVLFLILEKLGYKWANTCYHLSYGMVDLPSGKMKSREGTVVDADDLMEEMVDKAAETAELLGKLDGLSSEEKQALYEQIGLAALKYFILKVDPRKRMLFDPKESIDFNGNTGPFIQYTHARIQAILGRAGEVSNAFDYSELNEKEWALVRHLYDFESAVSEAGKEYSPAIIANYTYDLVKHYNSFYQTCSIFGTDDNERDFRVYLSSVTGETIAYLLQLLGVAAPSRM